MEEWTHETIQELGWSSCLYISDWFLGLLSLNLSCALETMESKTTFLFKWFVMPDTKEVDDCAVTVIRYLYPYQRTGVSVEIWTAWITQWKRQPHFPHLQKHKLGISEVCHIPGVQVALAETMKSTWQAGSQICVWTLQRSGWSFLNSFSCKSVGVSQCSFSPQ